MKNTGKLAYTFIVVFVTAYLSSYFNKVGMENFYGTQQMPPLTPQNMVFPIVWTLIYALMILSFFMVSLKADAAEFKRCNFWFLGQLVLHILWSYAFFYSGMIGAAAIVILLLIFNVIMMLKEFHKVDKWAAYLQYPYLLWVMFAAYLNIAFAYYNGLTVTW